jgi:hypothetical protein
MRVYARKERTPRGNRQESLSESLSYVMFCDVDNKLQLLENLDRRVLAQGHQLVHALQYSKWVLDRRSKESICALTAETRTFFAEGVRVVGTIMIPA